MKNTSEEVSNRLVMFQDIVSQSIAFAQFISLVEVIGLSLALARFKNLAFECQKFDNYDR